MINQSNETKGSASLLDLLGGNTKASNTKSNDIFSKLLASFGMQNKENDSKIIKSNDFKTVIDPKNLSLKSSDTKISPFKELQTLLGGNEEKESPFISKELLGALSNDQVRTLIHRAKEYLKHEIAAASPNTQIDTKTVPKTLAGLIQLAEKMGLEPQSITLAALVNDTEEKGSFPAEMLTKPLLDTKAVAALPAEGKDSSPFETITQLLNEIKGKEHRNTKTSSTEIRPQEASEKIETQPLKTLLQNIDKRETEITVTAAETSKAVSTAPVNVKTDGLLALLHGNNEPKEAKTEGSVSQKAEGDINKTLHAPKADSLEVKSKEASQSMRLFASELKEAVQDYKPPFTRLTMKLNPEKLGEVEVTLVQRGNNVHVNIQSNNTNSVAFLAHNATELKAQLASQGITNTTMNFMSGGEGQTGQQTQQQHQEQRQHLFRTYTSFEELELSEEQLSALEIIIPHYA